MKIINIKEPRPFSRPSATRWHQACTLPSPGFPQGHWGKPGGTQPSPWCRARALSPWRYLQLLLLAQTMGIWGKDRHLSLKIKPSVMRWGVSLWGELPVVAFVVLPILNMHPSPLVGQASLPRQVLAEPGAGDQSLKGACKLFRLM